MLVITRQWFHLFNEATMQLKIVLVGTAHREGLLRFVKLPTKEEKAPSSRQIDGQI